jgi:DNA helicase-2/ATP-dependent DNA helicase PcrA
VKRKEKKLFTAKSSGAVPELYEYVDEHEEARGVAQWIQKLRNDDFEYRQIAVFYRMNSMSRVLEEAFRRSAIPYQIVHGLEFFQRAEIKDMLAYLRILANPCDQISLKRIINRPLRGIGQTTIDRLLAYSQASGMEVWQVISQVDQVSTLPAAAKTKVRKFAAMMGSFLKLLDQPIKTIMQTVYEQSGLAKSVEGEKTEEKKANVEELINSAAEYDEEAENPSLPDYLQRIALVSDADSYDEQAGAVSVMTLHAAKGLEFPAVAIIGVEDGLIPHIRSSDSNDEIEEERRLLFVGVTRAKQRLVLSFARNRTVQGSKMATIRSAFLRGLDGIEQKSADCQDFDDDIDDEQEDIQEPYYEKDDEYGFDQYQRGQLVRHPQFGLGRIKEIYPNGADTKALIQFNNGPQKTLFLQYAKLENLDFKN